MIYAMITRIETLPNEILFHIFSYLSWFDILTSFWSLNNRFNHLVCSTISNNNNRLNGSLLFTRGLSYSKCSTMLIPLILNSSSLSSSIQCIHFDETNSSAYDLCYEWLFNDENILRFSNLKSLILTRCGSIISKFESLSYLIEHQLEELTLTFHNNMFFYIPYIRGYQSNKSDIEKQTAMLGQLVCQLFSAQCNLKSLQLDISNMFMGNIFYQCLESYSFLSSNSIQYEHRSSCVTLRRLHIRVHAAYLIENLIECLPNIEEMSVQCNSSLKFNTLQELNVEVFRESNENWSNKMPKLRYFSLKTFIFTDAEFFNLKWLLNNLNYIEKLQVHLKSGVLTETDCQSKDIWKSFIDASFIHQYCLPDITSNLVDFDFYICFQCQLSFNDIEKIIHSFQIHPFFIEHQWTNIKYLYDPIMSCQHFFSSFPTTFHFTNISNNYSFFFNGSSNKNLEYFPCLSLHLFLEHFNELPSNISSIKIYKRHVADWNESDLLMSSEILFKMRQNNQIAFPFRNVTKIQFGIHFNRRNARSIQPKDRNPIREKVLVHLISMTVQLKYLIIEQFEWLLHVVQYTSNELRTNALSTVRYAEFCLPCSYTNYKETSVGKHFVPVLSKYMPQLETLRLWRSDDFPWSCARPGYKRGYPYVSRIQRWIKSLETSQSIAEHVSIFEQDLCQLVEQLKHFTFLDMYGEIPYEKIEPYRLMVQTRFPYSHISVEWLRFRLWL